MLPFKAIHEEGKSFGLRSGLEQEEDDGVWRMSKRNSPVRWCVCLCDADHLVRAV